MIPTWLMVLFVAFGLLVVVYCVTVAIDVHLWWRDVHKGRR